MANDNEKIMISCKDANGKELQPGDIVEVTVKYCVLRVYDGQVLAQKVYDVPASALRKTGETLP
jgi:hypothetical protein